VNAAEKRRYEREYGHYDIKKIRWMMLWATPFLALLIGMFVWLFLLDLDLYRDLTEVRPPVIRRHTMMGTSLAMIPALLLMWACMLSRALRWHRLADALVWWMVGFLVIAVFAMLAGGFASTAVPQSYYPDYGYSQCPEVRRASRTRAPVWLRDAKWCVPGRDIDWVQEQAAKEQQESNITRP
jgi:hypothetical protein